MIVRFLVRIRNRINGVKSKHRGHALMCGRTYLIQRDIDLVIKVALSSMPPFLQIITLSFLIWVGGLILEIVSPQHVWLIYFSGIGLMVAYYGLEVYKRKDDKKELIKYFFKTPERAKRTI